MKKILILVADDGAESRLDRYLHRLYPYLTFVQIAKMVRKGDIRVNKGKVTSGHRLEPGDEIRLPPQTVLDAYKTNSSFTAAPAYVCSPKQLKEFQEWILFEDKNILVLNKPSGIAVQGGSKITHHIDGLLQAYGAQNHSKYRLVHRIDKDTSGLLVVAKTIEMAQQLTRQFADRSIKKEYIAITCGIPYPLKGTINAPMAKMSQEGHDFIDVVDEDDSNRGQEATTTYKTLDTTPSGFGLLNLYPHTGRMHQLRVHLATIDCPILGDEKYNKKNLEHFMPKRLFLHAQCLTLKLSNGNYKTFNAPLTAEWQSAIQALGFDYNIS